MKMAKTKENAKIFALAFAFAFGKVMIISLL